MAPAQDMEVEGVTTFKSSPPASYRYVIQLKSEKMSIWMENRISKKQWYKGDMAKADYVTSGNTITDASAMDYLKCFQDVLDCQLDDDDDVEREFEVKLGGGTRLTFAVTIRILRSTRVAKFTFDLDPVSVERIDILESKLRDQQDELERLRQNVEPGQVLSSIQLTASTKNTTSTILIWNKAEVDDFTVSEAGTMVKTHYAGLYNIAVVVDCFPSGHNQTVSLMKNGECAQMVYCPYQSGHHISVTLNTIARLEQDALLTLRCSCNVGSASYLSIVQLQHSEVKAK